MSSQITTAGDAAAIIEHADRHRVLVEDVDIQQIGASKHRAFAAERAPFLVLHTGEGMEVKSLKPFVDEWRLTPERLKGTATLHDPLSLAAYVARFMDEHSRLFADRGEGQRGPALVAVLDHHVGHDAPRFGGHRAVYRFPLSREWSAWLAGNGKPMTQGDFAAFVEERCVDIVPLPPELARAGGPTEAEAGGDFGRRSLRESISRLLRLNGGKAATPERMVELSRGLAVYEAGTVKNAIKLASGEATIHFASEHQDADGKPIDVPSLFIVAVPVFEGSTQPLYTIPVRLRYRVRSGAIAWVYEFYHHDQVLEHAFREVCEDVARRTGVELLYGSPEG